MGPEVYIVAAVIVLLFGGSQLPKLARSLGEAKREFESGQHGTATSKTKSKTKSDQVDDDA